MFPPVIARALAIPANNRTGTIADVEHVVILMQENRSFDHYFGTHARRARLRRPLHRSRCPAAARSGSSSRRHRHAVLPFHLDAHARATRQRVDGTPHYLARRAGAWDEAAWRSGRGHKTQHSMGYYRQAELPVPVRAGRRLHDLRRLPLLDAGAAPTPTACSCGPARNDPTARRAAARDQRTGTTASAPPGRGLHWTTYPERLRGRRRQLEGLPGHGRQLHRQPAGRLQAVSRGSRCLPGADARRHTADALCESMARSARCSRASPTRCPTALALTPAGPTCWPARCRRCRGSSRRRPTRAPGPVQPGAGRRLHRSRCWTR